ncbi:MAG: hypothetical protein GQ565_04115 [Candidatus Aegiribacteria sp.]|nr:hypothetical protein [Candidatus Aegiribacteria sp.]
MLFIIILFTVVLNPIVSSSEESITGTICGIVTTYRGHPLEGATVMIAGTPIGAMTGVNGEFIFTEVAQGSYTLIAGMVGLRDVSIDVIVTGDSRVAVEFKLRRGFSEEIPILIEI